MDKSAIEQISSLATAAATNQFLNGAIITQKDQQLVSLEHLQDQPNSFKGQFKTSLLTEFNEYVNKNADYRSSVFIDHDNMTATAIMDLGDGNEPHWGRHKASIHLKDTPTYQAVKANNDRLLKQQDFIDFVEDFSGNISFFWDNGDGTKRFETADKTTRILRRLKVTGNAEKEQVASNYAQSLSTLEQIEIKAGQEELPAGFVFTTQPYEGFADRSLFCQLRAASDEKEVKLKYRIMRFEKEKEEIAGEFRTLITAEISTTTQVYIGNMNI